MLLKYRRLRHKQDPVELNITAFLALMVILVPFLLLTLVFTRLSVINTPFPSANPNPQEKVVQPLEILFDNNVITVQNFAGEKRQIAAVAEDTTAQDNSGSSDSSNNSGTSIQNSSTRGTYDLDTLGAAMQALKTRFPEETKARLVFAGDVSYEVMLNAMQKVSSVQALQDGKVIEAQLFPSITRGLAAPSTAEPTDTTTNNAEGQP